MCLCVCPFAIETTFPLSNFKIKHIFGILMTLRKFLKPWAPQAPPEKGTEGARNMGRRRHPTFPLSDFKTKHIFEILMERVTSLKPFRAPQAPPERGAEGAPKCFFFAPNFFLSFFYRRRRRQFPKWAPEVPQRGH